MMEAHRLYVPTFPMGLFDFRDIPWVKHSAKGRDFLQAYIPSDRVKDFIDGECLRGNAHFCVHKTRIVSEGQAAPPTAACDVKETTYHCCYGPKDYSRNVPSATPLGPGRRRGKISRGASMKRGCLCHFMVRMMATHGGIAELRMYCSDHHNAAGETCHGQQCSQRTTQHPAPCPELAPQCPAAASTVAGMEAAASPSAGGEAAEEAREAAGQPGGHAAEEASEAARQPGGQAVEEAGEAARQPGGHASAAEEGQPPAQHAARRQVSAKEELLRTVRMIQDRLAEHLADDDPRCALLAACVHQTDLHCQRILATPMPEGVLAAAAHNSRVQAAAREPRSLKRATACQEQARRCIRQQRVQHAPAVGAAGSPGQALPLLQLDM